MTEPAVEDAPNAALSSPAPAQAFRNVGIDDLRPHWVQATAQSLFFLGIMHGFRMTEDKTRRELGGPFWGDYNQSVRGLHGWDDGGKQFTNYVAHPAEGAAFAHIWVNNDPAAQQVRFGASRAYATTRLRAFSWAVLWSTLFEIGPLSEASLGNVGSTLGRQGYVDLVMTPVVGTAEMVAEEALDLHVVRWVERRTGNGSLRAITRIVLNPTRSFSNLLRFQVPWYRYDRPLRPR